MDSQAEHQELITALLSAQSMIVLFGYQSTLYEPLEAAGWSRIDIEVPAYTSDTRERRTECLWINPQAQAALSSQRPLAAAIPANDNVNGDLFGGDTETRTPGKLAMAGGALTSHALQTDLTEARIIEEVRTIRQSGRKVRIQDVAAAVGMTRHHVGRRYKHCFG
jgi:DNA adenine methylase